MIIPDLDEEGGADADTRIAHAPRNVNRKIPTLSELEYEVKVALPNSAVGLLLVCRGCVLIDMIGWIQLEYSLEYVGACCDGV